MIVEHTMSQSGLSESAHDRLSLNVVNPLFARNPLPVLFATVVAQVHGHTSVIPQS
jgi:hypothetical protein